MRSGCDTFSHFRTCGPCILCIYTARFGSEIYSHLSVYHQAALAERREIYPTRRIWKPTALLQPRGAREMRRERLATLRLF
jgi:hypothetical protein